ncbi:MAG: peptidylprolyl isomerase [Betaproteobacteria bacterium]|nr:MAG: peptidylprolyl isomerase [Betaproteobacteria bacterium]TAG50190.1 MAG: peptidylprolyl isomerase [Betaproteobacteria bacterium]
MQKQKLFITAAVALASSVALAQTPAKKPAAPAAAPASAASAAKAPGGDLVSQAQLDLIVKERVAQGQPDTPELRAFLRDELTNRELFVRAAKAKGMDRDGDTKTQMLVASESVLIRSYIADVLKASPVGEDVLKKEYDTIKAGLGDKEFRARHVLVEKKEEAEAVIKQLQAGGNFEAIAKASSKDPGSQENGGDLDWAVPSNFVKPFADALVALEKGKYTPQPVQSPFGFHVIKLEDVREAKAPPYEEVKPQIAQRLQGQVIEKHLLDLRTKAGIK